MSYHIAFDIAHKPRGRIDDNLTELQDHLNSNDFICYNLLEASITEEALKPFDILVFVCPDFSKVSPIEISEIVKWVKNSGGGLLLLSHAGGDKGRGSNLSEISGKFGINFENDQVLDEKLNLGMENVPLISTFNIPHPITAKIDTLCYRSGCSLSIVSVGAFSIADSNESSEPFSCPIICVSEIGKGRVCCMGSYEMFRDKIGGGFQCQDHHKLALNTFKWLISDYRIELRSSNSIPTPITQKPDIFPDIAQKHKPQLESDTLLAKEPSVGIDFAMRISAKSELMELLKIFQNQINTIKVTIDKLIDTASDSDMDIIEIKRSELSEIVEDNEISLVDYGESPEIPQMSEMMTNLSPNKKSNEESVELTSLPEKPKSLIDVESEKSGEFDIKPAPKLETKEKTNKELKQEKKGLELKLSSVLNLLKFIDKKRSSGSLDEQEYSKRSKKLQNDLKKTKKRIGLLDKLLSK
ncbi:hypothetical protein LCGC14_0636630 [marine sediment metagenome]|uniref:Uncharacterized protein n=1 Tax=marine sediment metagenome TaxID=412755 RepID=A0A0F9RJM5_9ZZZZ|nr:MAG: hypothetical protein Lokiarch_10470 [Candidatus Lokiarchaeum sp. GC14_75]